MKSIIFKPISYLDMHVYQEDAQEFMSFLLDKMHEELLQGKLFYIYAAVILVLVMKSSIGEVSLTASNDDEWVEVGKGNKTSVMLTVIKISIGTYYIA